VILAGPYYSPDAHIVLGRLVEGKVLPLKQG
jgi:hypothetical protein